MLRANTNLDRASLKVFRGDTAAKFAKLFCNVASSISFGSQIFRKNNSIEAIPEIPHPLGYRGMRDSKM